MRVLVSPEDEAQLRAPLSASAFVRQKPADRLSPHLGHGMHSLGMTASLSRFVSRVARRHLPPRGGIGELGRAPTSGGRTGSGFAAWHEVVLGGFDEEIPVARRKRRGSSPKGNGRGGPGGTRLYRPLERSGMRGIKFAERVD